MQAAGSLFQLQTELVDRKIDMAASSAIASVVEQIISLRQEMHQQIGGLRQEMHTLKDEMNQRFFSLEGRMVAVETALRLRSQFQGEIRSRFLDYSFRAGWLMVGALFSVVVSYLAVHLHV